jgi:hypothetical protein
MSMGTSHSMSIPYRKVLPRSTDNRPDPQLDREPVLIGMKFAGDYTLQ